MWFSIVCPFQPLIYEYQLLSCLHELSPTPPSASEPSPSSFPPIAPSKDAAADVHKAWEFCKHRSKSMEVFYRNMEDEKILTRVHFQFDPVVSGTSCTASCTLSQCLYPHPLSPHPPPHTHTCTLLRCSLQQNELRDEVVENVKWNVNRDSAEDKLRDFLEWLYAVKKDTIHNVCVHACACACVCVCACLCIGVHVCVCVC